jgi:ATP-binding cassette subfamily B protein
MQLAGLGEKLSSLPQGIHTRLDKQLYPDAIELSGGEAQKLMLARALYKDAPILVLDEPTAALDPIAENQIYLQYQKMTRGKTSLFISHRLASTQFCDRVLYLKDGRIAEEGTHQELIALGGEYANLYEKQSCWYKCEGNH